MGNLRVQIQVALPILGRYMAYQGDKSKNKALSSGSPILINWRIVRFIIIYAITLRSKISNLQGELYFESLVEREENKEDLFTHGLVRFKARAFLPPSAQTQASST